MQYLTPDDFKRAEAHGINERLLKDRFYYKGWEKERAITQARKKFPIRDKKLHEWLRKARKNGIEISDSTMKQRMRHGWTEERATTKPVKETFITDEQAQTAIDNGIRYNLAVDRIKRGWTVERAITEKPPIRLKEYYDIAEKKGIPKKTVRNRVWVLGWSVEKAITIPKKRGKKKEKYEEAVRNGLDIEYSTYLNRLRNGWTEEEAITIKKTDRRTERSKYRTIAKKNGIPQSTYDQRVSVYGWDYKRAATEPINKKFRRK